MKITGIDIHLATEWRTFLFVEVHTDEGISGLGEAGITSRELAVQGMLQHFEPLLIGQNPFNTEDIWQSLFRGAFFPAGQIVTTAIAAIDMALWDIKGKALNVPVYQLIGGLARNKVLTYNHLHGTDRNSLLEYALQSEAEGWRCMRFEPSYREDHVWRPQESIAETTARWAMLREHLHNDVYLALDAHTRFNVAEAAQLCNSVAEFNPFFVEDCLRSELSDGYAALRQQTSVSLAAGEQFAHKWDFKSVLQQQWINIARIDVCIAGGITEALKIAHIAECNGIDIAVHNPIGPVSTAACLHLNLAISNMAVQELPKRPGETMADAIESDLKWEDGYLLAPESSGLGIKLHKEVLKKYPFKPQELPKLRNLDGSFRNW